MADRELLGAAADVLTDTASLLSGADVRPGFDRLEAARAASAAHQQDVSGDPDAARVAAAQAFHAQAIAVAARTAAADALIATRRADPETIAAERRGWAPASRRPGRRSRETTAGRAGGQPRRRIQARQLPFGVVPQRRPGLSAALAVAVAVADLSGVQHGFWVVPGHPVGAADQRSGDRGHGVAGTGRDRGRIR